jgi:hypothetical protein
VWAFFDVLHPTLFDLLLRIPNVQEPIRIQTFIKESPVIDFQVSVAFWPAEESRRGFHLEKAELGLKIRAHTLRAVIVPQPHASRDGFAEATEPFLHGLPHWLEGLKARAAFGCVNAQAIGGIVVDHGEDRHLAILSRKPAVASMPHILLGRSARIVPSWRLDLTGCGCRPGASKPCSRISRSTRRLDVRTPASRSRAHTLRWPSPWKGGPTMDCAISPVSSWSV